MKTEKSINEEKGNGVLPLVSGSLPVYPPHYATMIESIIKQWDIDNDVPTSERVAMKHMASEIFRIFLVCRRQ